MASRPRPRATPRRMRLRHASGTLSDSSRLSNEACVAETRGERDASRNGGRLHGERENLRVGRFGVPAAEALESGLRAFAALAGLSAENRAQIGIFRGSAGVVRSEIGAADGDRIFGPQAKLLARGVGGQEQAAANFLPRHVEKDRRGMKDRRLRSLEASLEEIVERAFAGASRRLARRIGGGRRMKGRRHRMALKVLGAPFNKAARRAQPFSRGRVNRQSAPRFRLPPLPGHGRMHWGARRRITL